MTVKHEPSSGLIPSQQTRFEHLRMKECLPRSHLLPEQLCEVVEIFGYLRIAGPECVLINRQGLLVQKACLLILALKNSSRQRNNDTRGQRRRPWKEARRNFESCKQLPRSAEGPFERISMLLLRR